MTKRIKMDTATGSDTLQLVCLQRDDYEDDWSTLRTAYLTRTIFELPEIVLRPCGKEVLIRGAASDGGRFIILRTRLVELRLEYGAEPSQSKSIFAIKTPLQPRQ